eukprot:GEMP01016881.1.p1 GENE.GEMP01016881.1~~GEMP01016881.1.p1  ORF type:complete len:772 (+),score=171.40 GEMP01016881.1:153-2468(+)
MTPAWLELLTADVDDVRKLLTADADDVRKLLTPVEAEGNAAEHKNCVQHEPVERRERVQCDGAQDARKVVEGTREQQHQTAQKGTRRVDLAEMLERNNDVCLSFPRGAEPYVGNKVIHVLRKREADAIRALFRALERQTRAPTQLTGWDLYHGHVFGKTDGDEVWNGGGILFHAKEHPKEFTESKAIFPVGSHFAGGDMDPRLGTTLSINDADFCDRNFLFCGTALYLILVKHPTFPRRNFTRGLGRRFCTMDEHIFGPAKGIVHYLPQWSEEVFYEPVKPAPPESTSPPLTPYREGLLQRVAFRAHRESGDPKLPDFGLQLAREAFQNPWLSNDCALAMRALAVGLPNAGPLIEDAMFTFDDECDVRFDVALASMNSAPKCCLTHQDLFAREICLQSMPLQCSPRSSVPLNDAYCVLVGGESGGRMVADKRNTRSGKYLAGHCSVQNVGQAYAALVPYFGKAHMVVICQVRETLEWLKNASASEKACEQLAGRRSLLETMGRQYRETLEDCKELLADGGAQYDYTWVNPKTVMDVLRELTDKTPRSVLLILNSHGNCHAANPGRQDGHDEWYLHFPYPAPESWGEVEMAAYKGLEEDDVSTDWGAPKQRFRLYSQQLFKAYHCLSEWSPHTSLICLYQFCLSGGFANILSLDSYKNFFGTTKWPMYLMVTSKKYESALGSFMGIWVRALRHALEGEPECTLGDLYDRVEKEYWGGTPPPVAASGSFDDDKAPTTLGTIGVFQGQRGGKPMSHMRLRDIVNYANAGIINKT